MDGRVEGANAWRGATAGSTDRRRASGSGAAGVVARAMPGVVVIGKRGGAMRRSGHAWGGAGWESRTAGGDQTAGTVGRDGGGKRVSMERGRSGAATLLAAGKMEADCRLAVWRPGVNQSTHAGPVQDAAGVA